MQLIHLQNSIANYTVKNVVIKNRKKYFKVQKRSELYQAECINLIVTADSQIYFKTSVRLLIV